MFTNPVNPESPPPESDSVEAEQRIEIPPFPPSARVLTRFLSWFTEWPNIIAIALAVAVLVLHLIIINDVESQILDEQHYIPEANALLDGEDLSDEKYNPEHPSLGKLLIAGSIESFGDKPLGWRMFSVLFGVASIILFYLICRKLTSKKWLPPIAAFLFAFENMNFVLSSVAMLDVFYVTFMLAGFWLYLHNRYIPAAVFVALSAMAKLSGVFVGGIILLHWIISSLIRWRNDRSKPKLGGILFIVAAPAAFFGLMPLFDRLALNHWEYPWDRIDYMLDTSQTLTFASVDHPSEARPWDWILSPDPMWFWYDPTYQSALNWTLWALIIPIFAYGVYRLIRCSNLGAFTVSWITGTWLVWIPVVLVTDRVLFNFYFYPAIGAICLLAAAGIHQILEIASKRRNVFVKRTMQIAIAAFLMGHLAAFIIMSPYCPWPPASY